MAPPRTLADAVPPPTASAHPACGPSSSVNAGPAASAAEQSHKDLHGAAASGHWKEPPK